MLLLLEFDLAGGCSKFLVLLRFRLLGFFSLSFGLHLSLRRRTLSRASGAGTVGGVERLTLLPGQHRVVVFGVRKRARCRGGGGETRSNGSTVLLVEKGVLKGKSAWMHRAEGEGSGGLKRT